LQDLLEQRLSVPSANAAAKAACVMAGMLAGADSIDDLDVLRHGGMGRVLTDVRAPSTLGTFLRSFAFGHVRQLDAVHTRVLAGLATVVPRLLAGVDGLAFIDIDDTIREVHGYAKQGAGYGYSGVKGVNAQIAALSSPTCAPVIAASRLRKGNVVSGHGADRMFIDAIATARAAGACGLVMVRADSGYYRRDLIAAAVTAKAWFSVTVRMNSSVRPAITAIPDTSWTTTGIRERSGNPRTNGGSARRKSPRSASPRSSPTPRNGRSRAGWRAPGATAQSRGEERTGRAVHDVASPRVRHQLHPHRDRRGRDPP